MLQSCQTQTAFHLKSGQYLISTLQLLETDIDRVIVQLSDKINQAPKFFSKAPIVLDLTKTTDPLSLDLPGMVRAIKKLSLCVVGLKTNHPHLQSEAERLGLPLFSSQTQPWEIVSKASQEQTNRPAANTETTYCSPKVILEPIRSGQQVYAKNTDLIVLNTVSPGAEIMADGNIYIYASVKGRVLAGLHGNKNALIFCHQLQTELVSIAGHYNLSEELPTQCWDKSVIISWSEQELVFKLV